MPDINHLIKHPLSENDTQVNLKITIGDEQVLYTTRVSTPLGEYHSDVLSCALGKTSEIRGKSTLVVVTIKDANPNTNRTSVTIQLSNKHLVQPFSVLCEQDNCEMKYYIQIDHQQL